MSLRTTERIFITSSLALMLAAGCGDGDHLPTEDAGGSTDAGKHMDAGHDTGTEEEVPATSCGSKTCTGTIVQQTVINPCCVPETNGCGLNAEDLRRANSSTPFTGCIPKDVEAAVENSAYCGEFWDQVEMVPIDNGGLDIASGAVTLTFDGCCLPSGECGAMIDTPRNQDPEVVNTHLGCVSYSRLQMAFAAADAGSMQQPPHLPFCNPATGEPPMGTETVPGVPKFVCGCGNGNVYDPMDTTRTFPCLSNLPTTVCGVEEPKDTELAQVPEFICGCVGATSNGLPCMTNIDKAVCGTKQIDANSPELARVPVFICGADGGTPTPLPTLKGVASTVCGTKPVPPDSSDLKTVPEFLCGCTAANAATGFPCLRNLAHSVCGALPVDGTSSYLTDLPEYLCGCGADTVDPQTSLTCLSHVETNVCGKTPVTDAAALSKVPETLCGCGDGVIAARCLPNVPNNLCGTADATASLAGLPDFLCGCGDGVLASGRPCLNNIPKEQCGALDVASSTVTYLPASLCGCGPTVTYDTANPAFTSPCLSKTAYNECGGGPVPVSDNGTPDNAADDCFTNIASYVRGCGEGIAENTASRTCLPNGKNTMFGCNFPAAGMTIASQPTYACGCGVGSFPQLNPPECIPNTAYNACGSAAPNFATLPTYLCGCGGAGVLNRASATSASAPCLSNVAAGTCGTNAALNTPYLGRLPASVCGCGASTPYALSATLPPCLSNQALSVCGTLPIPTTTRTGLPTCYTGWPEYVRGCGAAPTGTYPWTCIPNGTTTSFGCNDVTSALGIQSQYTFMCGCGENVGPASAVPCLPNVDSAFCGARTFTGLPPGLPNNLCGCDPDTSDGTVVKYIPGVSPGPCISTQATTTCGAISPCGPIGFTGACSSGACADTNADGVGNICQ
jgi:hypothetical protein